MYRNTVKLKLYGGNQNSKSLWIYEGVKPRSERGHTVVLTFWAKL